MVRITTERYIPSLDIVVASPAELGEEAKTAVLRVVVALHGIFTLVFAASGWSMIHVPGPNKTSKEKGEI